MKKLASFLLLALFCLSAAFSMDVYISFDETHFTQKSLDEYPEYYFRYHAFKKVMKNLESKGINLINCDRIQYPYFNFSEIKCELRTDFNEKKVLQFNGLFALGFVKEQSEFYNMTKEELDRIVNSVALTLESFLISNLLEKNSEENPPYLIDTLEVGSPFDERSGAYGQIVAFDDYSFATIFYYPEAFKIFNAAGKETADLAELEPSVMENHIMGKLWTDGKNTLEVSSPNKNKIYEFVRNGDLLEFNKKTSYNGWRTGETFVQMTENGDPFFFSYDRGEFLFPSKNRESERKVKFTKYGNATSYRITKDNLISIISDNLFMQFDFDRNLQKVLILGENYKSFILEQILDDGSFIVTSYQDSGRVYIKFDKNGTRKWTLNNTGYLANAFFSTSAGGMLYFYDTSHRIFRYAEQDAQIPSFMKNLSERFDLLQKDPIAENDQYIQIAEEYERNGGNTLAYRAYCNYLDKSPNNPAIVEKKLAAELKIRKEKIRKNTNAVLDLYENQGRYSAQAEFLKAVPELEKLMKKFPNDEELHENYKRLVDLFDPDNGSAEFKKEIEIKSVDMVALLPALKNYYSKNPAGYITIENATNSEIKNLSVTCSLMKYMDFATESKTFDIMAGKEVSIPLQMMLNNRVLDISENTDVQVQFIINYTSNGKKKKLAFVRPVTLYNKNAISWNDTSMASCFIQSNDATVTSLAYKAMRIETESENFISKNFFQAMKIVNAVGSIPLNYVSDPVTPVSSTLDNDYAIDTVRFPSETLRIKGGDCDDMTTLLCSLFEASGIQSMLITIPGHILCAFNTGTKNNFIWEKLSDGGFSVLTVDDEIWIPVECTAMTNGFYNAWKTAAMELSANKIQEKIIVSKQRDLFPPIAAGTEDLRIDFKEEVAKNFCRNDYFSMGQDITAKLADFDSSAFTARELNILAKMYHITGNDTKAVLILERAVSKEPGYKASKKNLEALKNKGTVIIAKDNKSEGRASSAESDFDWKE